jgi:hypothetical protein
LVKVPEGTSVKVFRVFCSNFEKSLKIVEKSEKCKTNFVGFVVKNPTTFLILARDSS